MPWRDKGTAMPASSAEAGLLVRLQQAARMSKYDADEAQDICKAGVEAAARHMETTCPDADFVIIGSVPFGTDPAGGRGPGNAIAQRITGGRLLGCSMREDVLPQQARFFTAATTPIGTFRARLVMCWRILFGNDPKGYERDDL